MTVTHQDLQAMEPSVVYELGRTPGVRWERWVYFLGSVSDPGFETFDLWAVDVSFSNDGATRRKTTPFRVERKETVTYEREQP